jgi:hypothetical protein
MGLSAIAPAAATPQIICLLIVSTPVSVGIGDRANIDRQTVRSRTQRLLNVAQRCRSTSLESAATLA